MILKHLEVKTDFSFETLCIMKNRTLVSQERVMETILGFTDDGVVQGSVPLFRVQITSSSRAKAESSKPTWRSSTIDQPKFTNVQIASSSVKWDSYRTHPVGVKKNQLQYGMLSTQHMHGTFWGPWLSATMANFITLSLGSIVVKFWFLFCSQVDIINITNKIVVLSKMKKATVRKISPHLEYPKHRHKLCLVSVKWFLTPRRMLPEKENICLQLL